MVLDPKTGISHHHFKYLLNLVKPDDLLVFNNTEVIPARLFAQKDSGGKVEVLVERLISDTEILAQVRASKSPKPGSYINLEDGSQVEMMAREGEFFRLRAAQCWLAILQRLGHMPLPPYIERSDEPEDQQRYQTVYASVPGAVAAPTAGLHFDNELLSLLRGKGVRIAEVTLHVASGTFQPMRVEDLHDHQMHAEWMTLSQNVVDAVKQTRQRGGRVIAVGTTSVRCLETASQDGEIKPYQGDTSIFIFPGYDFKVVDALVTNFHLPESTLMMLVSAFSGYTEIMQAYKEAVAQEYRFFSYGDAMFLPRNPSARQDIPK